MKSATPAVVNGSTSRSPTATATPGPRDARGATAPPAAVNAPVFDAPSPSRPADTAGSNCPGPGEEHAVLVFPRCRRIAHREGVERPSAAPAPPASKPKLRTKCGETIYRILMSRRGPAGLLQALPRPGLPLLRLNS